MGWQIIIVGILVFGSVVGLALKFRKSIRKPQSICDSCMMKNRCLADFDFADDESDDFPCQG